MLSTDLRALAGWARGDVELDTVTLRSLALRLEAAADRAAAIEATVVPDAARRQSREATGATVVRFPAAAGR